MADANPNALKEARLPAHLSKRTIWSSASIRLQIDKWSDAEEM